jgi:predicted amidohydrolase YtcJ
MSEPDAPVDLLLSGAAVYTSRSSRPWAEAVAVKDGRIVAVGTQAEAIAQAGRRTRVMDLAGRMVLPGFQDAHVHPEHGGLARARCNLHDATDAEAYGAIIRSYAESHPKAPWILGGGWSMDAFPGGTPHRSILDAIVPGRPVFLPNRDGHGAWVSSRALEMAGVTRDTPDPADGRIEREADGEPQGTLHEGAMDLVRRLIPAPTQDEQEDALRLAQGYLHSLGITAWQDAIVSPDLLKAYRAMADRGELTARVVAALWWERGQGLEQIDSLLAQRSWGTAGRLRATAVKIMQDGVIENFTAAVLEPYLDAQGQPTTNLGISFVEPDLLDAAVIRLDAEGFQVHIHAIGERAVREALNALEAAARTNGRWGARHHIAHIQVIHPDDVPRFAELEVVANAQPLWACMDGQMANLTIPFLGPERTKWQYPFASLGGTGARLAFGSDWPVSTPNPLLEMEVAVRRIAPDDRGAESFLPDERLDLEAAVDAFTMGSAFVNHLDDETGSIEVGKLADLVVLDRNLLEIEAATLGDAKVLLTLVEGQPVFASDEIGW